ncbi:hypothetical protein KI387_029107, partial [Taxus chinensis]
YGHQNPNGSPSWLWKDASTIEANAHESNLLKGAIQDKNTHFLNKDDSLIWLGDVTGSYSVKAGYNIFISRSGPGNPCSYGCWHP